MRSIRYAAVAALILSLSIGFTFFLVKDARAVKPPTKSQRAHNSEEKYTWSDLKPGKKAYTRSGKFCECGVSSTDPNACYYPKDGQYCCNPETGKCYMRELGKVNTPW